MLLRKKEQVTLFLSYSCLSVGVYVCFCPVVSCEHGNDCVIL